MLRMVLERDRMVEQLQPDRASAFPARPGRLAPASAQAVPRDSAAAEATAPRLLLLIVVFLLLPGTFQIAGTTLSPYRVLLLGLFPVLVWRWINSVAGRPNAVDILVLLSALWTVAALVVNHGLQVIPRGAIVFVELFGGYLVGRMLILNQTDYRNYFKYLTIVFAMLLPIALVEILTGFNILRKVFDVIFTIPPRQSNLGPRLGLIRAQGPLEHPILFGLVASMGVANVLYIYRNSFTKSVSLAAFFGFMGLTSVSSGPMLSILCQILLTAWDRLFYFMKGKWIVLAYVCLLCFLILRIASQFNLLDFVIQNLMFNPNTADGRLIILDYGTREVLRHPVFGIGLNDWERPWWRKSSFDNFWLFQAMRFGVPTLFFLALAWAVNFARIATQTTLSPELADYRRGYLFTLVGVTVTLGTVYIWNATSVFVWIYLGAGAWFYMQNDVDVDPDRVTWARRAAQARAFGTEPLGWLPRHSLPRDVDVTGPVPESGRVPR
jgi:hypothetical protein